jgi:hypothetical protein
VAEHRTGTRHERRTWWFVSAFVAVPAVLACVTLALFGPRIVDDLRTRSDAALVHAGLPGVTVALDGRDARLGEVPAGAEHAVTQVVGDVTGVREVYLNAGSAPAETAPAILFAPSIRYG